MGKVRKEKKYRLHKKAPDVLSEARAATEDVGDGEMIASASSAQPVVPPLPEEVMTSENVVSLRATDSTEADRGQVEGKRRDQAKKKDRRKLRREKWLQSKHLASVVKCIIKDQVWRPFTYIQEIEVCRMEKEEQKAASERKKTVIVGDMQPLATSLPIISST